MTVKTTQREHLARQQAHGASLRSWLQDRAAAAAKRLTEKRKAEVANPQSRGVDRVPARYRVTRPEPEVLVALPRTSNDRRRRVSPKPRLRELRSQRKMAACQDAARELNIPVETVLMVPGLYASVKRWTR